VPLGVVLSMVNARTDGGADSADAKATLAVTQMRDKRIPASTRRRRFVMDKSLGYRLTQLVESSSSFTTGSASLASMNVPMS